MRKTSHDGGDSTSITSGVENEIRKSAMKPKKSSLKRKAPNFSQDSDDTVIEPLLQRDKEKSEPQSAKYFGKGKTDSLQNDESFNKAKTTSTTGFCGTTESLLSFKDPESTRTTSSVIAPLHNYMNTNVFNTHDNAKANVTTKSQILVEIDSSKQSSYTPSPLIFTTAKIHTDAKTKQMEPVHVTTVPILSTIEVSMSKRGSITTNEKKISNGSSVINPVYSPMPLSKGKDEKGTVSNVSSVISPTINKDPFSKTVTIASATKLANNTTAQSSSMRTTLPSTVSNSLLMKSNANEMQGDTKDVKKDQSPLNAQLQSKVLNSDGTKNNVTVKTIISSSGGKPTDISTTSSIEPSKTSVNVSNSDSRHFTSNIKTPSSKHPVEIPNLAKNISSSVGNKQLQRQKTTTEEISTTESSVKPNIELSENSSAKMPSSSDAKINDTITAKDGKLQNVSANNTQSINIKSSKNNTTTSISETTAISTTSKPTLETTSVNSPIVVKTSTVISSKPASTTNVSNTGKTGLQTTISTKPVSNVNITSTNNIVSYTSIAKPEKGAKTSIPKSIVTPKYPDVTTIQTQPQTSMSKTLPETATAVNVSSSKPSVTSVNSDKNKAANMTTTKTSAVVAKTTTATVTQHSVTTSKNIATKTPVTTAAKTSISVMSSSATKPSSSTAQVSDSKPPLTTSFVADNKTSAVITPTPKTISGAVSSLTTTATFAPGSANKQAITAVGKTTTTKTSSIVTSGKPSTVSSSAGAPITTGVKSLINNSSQIVNTSLPSMTSIPKTESVTVSSKTLTGTSSHKMNTGKSSEGSSTTTSNIKDSDASVKKPMTKTQSITTKSPSVSSANKSIVGPTAEISSSEASMPTSATKKPDGVSLSKTGTTTASTKTPSVSTVTKTPDISSSSSTTTSAGAVIPTTSSATQVSANNSVGIAGSSVPSTTPILRPSESLKKGESKSSDYTKDGKL